jgi:hypothetical protein
MFVRLRQTWSSDDNPVELDGRRYGPFVSADEGQDWLAAVRSSGSTPHTLEDLYVGSVVGDAPRLCDWGAEGGPAVTRIEGVEAGTDAGRPIVLASGARRSLHPKTVVLLDGARRGRLDQERAGLVDDCYCRTPWVTIGKGINAQGMVVPGSEMPHGERGELLLVAPFSREVKCYVAWRPDRRSTQSLHVLSGHTDVGCARAEMEFHAEHWEPPRRIGETRTPPDRQRSRVYALDKPIVLARGAMRAVIGIDEARDYAALAWSSLGLEDPPPLHHRPRIGASAQYNRKMAHRPFGEILLADCGLRRGIILHELAHAVVDRLDLAPGEPGHGPTFVSVAMSIYVAHAGADRAEMEARATALKVAFAPPLATLEDALRAPRGDPPRP